MTKTRFKLQTELLPGVEQQHADALEAELKSFVSSRDLPLYKIMSFQLGWIDQNGDPAGIPTQSRMHGQFALATAAAMGGDPLSAVKYAIAVELLHNFALIHEDVEDGNTERNGRPSVWWTWGPAQAINAGDGMHAMARLALFSLAEQGEPTERVSAAVRAIDCATVLMCEGEYLDITFQEQAVVTPERYLEMTASRTGALFGCAAESGAIAAGHNDSATLKALFKFGQATAVARQLAVDHDLFWGTGPKDQVSHGRLLAKKKNLPVAHAMTHGSPSVKRHLGEMYMQRVIDPAKVPEIAALLEEAESRDFTEQSIERLAAEANEAAARVTGARTASLLPALAAALSGAS